LLELEDINREISAYLSGVDETEFLHRALKKQNSHLFFFQPALDNFKSYVEKHRIDPAKVIICADHSHKAELYDFLRKTGLRNYVLLNKSAKEINYTYLNFLIYIQRQKIHGQQASFNPANTYKVDEVDDFFEHKEVPQNVRQRFSTVYNEIVNNAIIHGKTESPILSFGTFADYLVFSVKDQAGEFNYSSLDKVFTSDEREVNPNTMRTAGIGLNMIHMYSEGIHYRVEKGKCTEATFFINFNKTLRYCGFLYCEGQDGQI